jgi:BRO family, N-terminal domain
MTNSLPAHFSGNPINIITLHGQPWIMGGQIGHSLGYADPSREVARMIRRNPNEFTLDDMMVVQLPDALGRLQLTRIFSRTGAIKIAMLSKTDRAVAFRDWAARTLANPADAPSFHWQDKISPSAKHDLKCFWLKHKPNRKFLKYAGLPLSNREVAILCGWKSPTTVVTKRRAAEALGLIAPDPGRLPSNLQRHLELKRAAQGGGTGQQLGQHVGGVQ